MQNNGVKDASKGKKAWGDPFQPNFQQSLSLGMILGIDVLLHPQKICISFVENDKEEDKHKEND
jgi:hypothetical protein